MTKTKTVMMPRELSQDDLKELIEAGTFYQTERFNRTIGEGQDIDVMISIETIKAIYKKAVEHFGE